MTTVCVIPARGGSKGIPRKNLQEVGGLTLVERAIRTVASSGTVEEILVSTDDPEIASVAVRCGAKHVRRPSDLATDDASSELSLIHALETLRITNGRLLFVQTTTPLLEPSDLVMLHNNHQGHDSSLTVCAFHGFVWQESSDGCLEGVNHSSRHRSRRQDLERSEYLENGGAYLMEIDGFLNSRHRFFGRIGYAVMPRLRSVEVDDLNDLNLVRQIHSFLYGEDSLVR